MIEGMALSIVATQEKIQGADCCGKKSSLASSGRVKESCWWNSSGGVSQSVHNDMLTLKELKKKKEFEAFGQTRG